jgi:hypothetical protein
MLSDIYNAAIKTETSLEAVALHLETLGDPGDP